MSFEFDPDKQFKLTPEGHYTFVVEEYEKRKTDRGKVFIIFKLTAVAPNGERSRTSEAFWPWEERWGHVLLALGGEKDETGRVHLADEDNIIGREFAGDIKHEPDKKRPDITRTRIINIISIEEDGMGFSGGESVECREDGDEVDDVPRPKGEEEDDSEIPF